MKKQLMIVVMIVSLATSCMVGPKYRRPGVKTPDVFRGTANEAAAPDPQSLADLKWFEVFKDEQLQELIRTALVQNYDLRDAVVRVEVARANLGITRADQFPTIAASADLTTLPTPAAAHSPSRRESVESGHSGASCSIFSPSRWIFGAGCAAPPKPRAPICWPPKRIAKP